MGTPAFLYKIVLTKNMETLAEIDWGNSPNWVDEYAEELDDADRLWLIPKVENSNLRNVSVKLGGGRRWIVFSRVFGRLTGGANRQVRVYAIGWQRTVEGVNQKSLTWIYPSGEVEVADDPSFAWVFLRDLE